MLARVLIYTSLSFFIVALGLWMIRNLGESPADPAARRQIAAASFACDDGKTIDARFYARSTSAAVPDRPPTPGGSVHLTLSDGRSLDLPQTLSADGARYAQADDSLVFWNKGNGAFVLEDDRQTFRGCIAIARDPGGLPEVYENGGAGFSIRHPAGYAVDSSYSYQALGPGKDIGGVKFTIAAATWAGTNLAADSHLSVEEIPRAASCTADRFLPEGATAATDLKDNGMTYSAATSTGAAAGNRYEETVYALPGTNPCMAVRYFIHYGVFQNYPAGAVREFDKQALVSRFDAMRRTLIVQQ